MYLVPNIWLVNNLGLPHRKHRKLYRIVLARVYIAIATQAMCYVRYGNQCYGPPFSLEFSVEFSPYWQHIRPRLPPSLWSAVAGIIDMSLDWIRGGVRA